MKNPKTNRLIGYIVLFIGFIIWYKGFHSPTELIITATEIPISNGSCPFIGSTAVDE